MIPTRMKIIKYLKSYTEKLDMNNTDYFSANKVADELKISRSSASQYLNELYKENYLIKIQSRPVLFFYKKILEQKYSLKFQVSEFLSIKAFEKYLEDNKKDIYNFEDIIGAYGSLKKIIDKFKACIKYPPRGLPILLMGEKWTGKSILVKAIYKYAVSEDIIPSSGKLIEVDIEELDNISEVISILFGSEDSLNKYPSKISESEDGIVYIKNSQLLNKKIIKKIVNFYSSEKRTDHIYSLCAESKARVVFDAAVTKEEIDKEKFDAIPITCYMPSLYERYSEEKEAYIYRYFQKESLMINKKIIVSTKVIRKLLTYRFIDNINELEKTIRIICANSNVEKNSEDHIKIYSYHLPSNISIIEDENYADELGFVDVSQYHIKKENKQLAKIFDSIIQGYSKIITSPDQDNNSFVIDSKQYISHYFEYLKFNNKMNYKNIKSIEAPISGFIENVFEMYNTNQPTNFTSLIAKSIFLIREYKGFIGTWCEENKKVVQQLTLYVQQLFKNEYEIVETINNYIYDELGISLDKMNEIIYTIHLSIYLKGAVKKKCQGIIVAHGYSTATSIADAVNTMVGKSVFDSIDMPLDSTAEEIVEKIKKYLIRGDNKSDLLVMVDMGSLQDIGSSLIDTARCNIGIINNVSTGIALEAALLIMQNKELPELLKKVSEASKSEYRFIKNKNEQPCIVFTSENGVNTARRLSELFVRSLPRKIDVDILTYDYFDLMSAFKIRNDSIERRILFIFGVSNLEVPGMSFVSLEDIMSMKKMDELYTKFSTYLSTNEINELKRNLTKSFSLENVMRCITILEPNRLFESVSESVEKLQTLLNVQFSNKTTMGLYIHISCLVERLVTKKVLDYGDTTKFKENQQDFILKVKTSFYNIFENYGVDLPLSEINYLYNYISLDNMKD